MLVIVVAFHFVLVVDVASPSSFCAIYYFINKIYDDAAAGNNMINNNLYIILLLLLLLNIIMNVLLLLRSRLRTWNRPTAHHATFKRSPHVLLG